MGGGRKRVTGVVLGVGINDAKYKIYWIDTATGHRKRCPYYSKWVQMLRRCYDEKYQKNEASSYKGCSVCKEWLLFSNFKSWMEKQDWEGKQLDKDILFPGNKVYSPKTCVFVPQSVNLFFGDCRATRGELPLGVHLNKETGKFRAQCCQLNGKHKHLGLFHTEIEAHQAWLTEKLRLAKILAEQQTDVRIKAAILNRLH